MTLEDARNKAREASRHNPGAYDPARCFFVIEDPDATGGRTEYEIATPNDLGGYYGGQNVTIVDCYSNGSRV